MLELDVFIYNEHSNLSVNALRCILMLILNHCNVLKNVAYASAVPADPRERQQIMATFRRYYYDNAYSAHYFNMLSNNALSLQSGSPICQGGMTGAESRLNVSRIGM